MLNMIVLSLLSITTIEDIEDTPGEWISSEVEFSQETIALFSEHGEMFQSEAGPYVGYHICFVNVGDQEKWRATVVFEDKIVLFEEDQEPLVSQYNFPIDFMTFSTSGNFVALFRKEIPEENSGLNGLRINTLTGDSQYFDSKPNGLNPFAIQWDDGSITFSRSISYNASQLCFMDSSLSTVLSIETRDLRIPGISEDYFVTPTSMGLTCFNRAGDEVWVSPYEGMTCSVPSLSISPDGKFLVMPFSEGNLNGLWLRSAETGEILCEYSLSVPYATWDLPVFLQDNSSWVCSSIDFDSDGNPQPQVVSGNVHNRAVSFRTFPVPDLNYRLVGVSNSLMQIRRVPVNGQAFEQSRCILTNQDFGPLFATAQGIPPVVIAGIQDWHATLNCALSRLHSRFLYTDEFGIYLLEMRE